MSIEESLRKGIDRGRLLPLIPEFSSDVSLRRMFLHTELNLELRQLSAMGGHDVSRRLARLQDTLESFVRGEHISLAMEPRKHKSAYMGLLHNVEDGTWDVRARDPNPGMRVFGRFASIDTFVCLGWAPRSKVWGGKQPLGNYDSLEYQLALLEAHLRWNDALPLASPLLGGTYTDYVSENSSLV